jgi:hypothetical protein
MLLPPALLDYIGCCNACGFGVGGILLRGNCPLVLETVWQQVQWPWYITSPAIISERNPLGALTNSGLETMALVLRLGVLEVVAPRKGTNIFFVHGDNTPNVAWITEMAKLHAAHRFIQGLALDQHMLKMKPVSITHVKGIDSALLANIALQPITHQLDDNSAFLMHFYSVFLLQDKFWQCASLLPMHG